MSGLCDDATNEKPLVNIANLPELAAVSHLGYRQVCAPCYDDLVAEANEVEDRDEDRRAEPRVKVSIKARVEGNTSHLDSFTDEMTIEEISPSGLRLHTVRDLEPGTLVKVTVPSVDVEATALVQAVWRDAGQHSVGLKLTEPAKHLQKLWKHKNAPEGVVSSSVVSSRSRVISRSLCLVFVPNSNPTRTPNYDYGLRLLTSTFDLSLRLN